VVQVAPSTQFRNQVPKGRLVPLERQELMVRQVLTELQVSMGRPV
jgi:hypothetical protein